MTRTRGRAPQGQRAVRIVGGRRGPNFTIILAISNIRDLLHHQINQGGTTAEMFNKFLTATSQAAGVDERVAFVMDNASCHRRATQADIG